MGGVGVGVGGGHAVRQAVPRQLDGVKGTAGLRASASDNQGDCLRGSAPARPCGPWAAHPGGSSRPVGGLRAPVSMH